MPGPLLIAAAAVVAVLAVGRAARLLCCDDYPPSLWLRTWLTARLPPLWAEGVECPFCWSPYLAAGDLAWVLLAGVHPDGFWSDAWWVVNGWAALSYAAAMVVARDQPEE